MKICVVHNRYRLRGGEDTVVDQEVELLRGAGHEVLLATASNASASPFELMAAAVTVSHSRKWNQRIDEIVDDFSPDLFHFHNVFPLISPSSIRRAKSRGIPTVMTLHNFRLGCPQGLLLRNGRVCEECVGKVPWRGVIHSCYRDSVAQSLAISTAIQSHRLAGTWDFAVDKYFALNEFCREKFIDIGLPAEKIFIKPNFSFSSDLRRYADSSCPLLFVGRLSEEKGLRVFLDALEIIRPSVRAVVVGDGPLRDLVSANEFVDYRGNLDRNSVLSLMSRASLLVVPSLWYENMPMVILEAFSVGLPVAASGIGALPFIVARDVSGVLFEPGSSSSLAGAVVGVLGSSQRLEELSRGALESFTERYSDAAALRLLETAYSDVVARLDA